MPQPLVNPSDDEDLPDRDELLVQQWAERWASATIANRKMLDMAATRVQDPDEEVSTFAIQIIAVGEDKLTSAAMLAFRRAVLVRLAQDWERRSRAYGQVSARPMTARDVSRWILSQANNSELPPRSER